MKTKNYFVASVIFLTGLFSGISIIGMYSFTGAPSSPPAAGKNTPVSAAEAHTCFVSYMADAVPMNAVIKGFTLDKAQLDAMNAISKENADLAGFRIYMGKDASAKRIGIVVGVDNTGKDAIKNTIFSTDSRQLSPCPVVCDVSSPIVLDK